MIPRSPRTAFLLGTLFFGSSVLLLQVHIGSVRQLRENVLPLAGTLLTLQHRSDVLTEQIAMAEEQDATREGSTLEKLHAYVLPARESLPRLLSFFEQLEKDLRSRKELQSLSKITVTDADVDQALPAGTRVQRAELTMVLNKDGMERVLHLLDLTGDLTVGDVLSADELQSLFNLTEAYNAAGIVGVESFLGSDLLSYAQAPQKVEQPVLQAFTSDQFLEQFRALLAHTKLGNAESLLGGDFGAALKQAGLWPTQWMEVAKVESTQVGEWTTLKLALNLYGRTE